MDDQQEQEVYPGEDAGDGQEYISPADDVAAAFARIRPSFGDLLQIIRERIGEAVGHELTQTEFGELLGGIDQVTVSRWQTGKQRPQDRHLEAIVALGHEYGLRGLTLARLQQSLNRAATAYADIDARIVRLNTLLLPHDEGFKTRFYEIVFAVYHLLNSVLMTPRR